jgi:hypothetical protein
MNYLTQYYKNLSENLQARLNYLQTLLNEEGDMQRDAEDAEDAEDQATLERLKASGEDVQFATRKEIREIMKDKERRQRDRDAGVDPDAPIGTAAKGGNFLGRFEEPNVPAPTKGRDRPPETEPTPPKGPVPEIKEFDQWYRKNREFERKMKEEERKWRGGGLA